MVFFVLLIFAGWFYFSDYKNKPIQDLAKEEKSPLAVVLNQTSQFEADSDSDGLKDWEELLWKTDPNKADTDNDGTNDNEEITLNRNPLKAGPDDKISDKEDLVAQEKAVSDSKQNTLTAAYARQFMTDYLLLKQQKGELTDLDKNALVGSFIDSLKPLSVADQYSFSNFKITDDVSSESVKRYSEEMKKIFFEDKHTLVNEGLAFEMLLKNIKDGNPDFKNNITNLEYSAAKHEELVKNLISFSVPNNLAKEHIRVVNGLNNTKLAIENMAVADKDPIKAMMGKKLYDEELGKTYEAINNIENIFEEYGIYVF